MLSLANSHHQDYAKLGPADLFAGGISALYSNPPASGIGEIKYMATRLFDPWHWRPARLCPVRWIRLQWFGRQFRLRRPRSLDRFPQHGLSGHGYPSSRLWFP